MAFVDRIGGIADALNHVNPLTWATAGAYDELHDKEAALEAATYEAARSMDTFAEKTAGAREPVDDISHGAGVATGRVKGLGGAAQKAADRFGDLKKNVDDAAQAIAEAAYGPEELRLEFAKNRMELEDNESALGKVQDKIADLESKGKKVPRSLRKEFLDLRAEVNDSKQSVIETGIKLESVGGIKMGALKKEFGDLDIHLSGLKGEAHDLWYWMNRASKVRFEDIVSGGGRGGKASGGYTAPGDVAVVGERGEMEAVKALPGGGFMTYPLDGRGAFGIGPQASAGAMHASSSAPAAAGAAGSPIVIQVVLPDRRVLAEAVAPGVTAWQQGRGLMARA